MKGTNKFELLYEQHPKQYKALTKLGIHEVLLNMGVPIRNDEEYMRQLQLKKLSIVEWYKQVKEDIELNGENSQYKQYIKYFEPKQKGDK